jgi:serine/threonine protein phosphatase PrpC
MYVTHTPRGKARLWQHDEVGLHTLAVWTERVPGKGEDADPLLLFRRSAGRGLIAVLDGAGGSGRALAGHTASGEERTQAWVASRRVRGLVEDWFTTAADSSPLHRHIADRFVADGAVRSRTRGSMHRSFPTTLACVDFWLAGDDVAWDVLWAGDSRCYVVEALHGMQQLSRDDADSADALELLVQDPPMTNMVSADRPFTLHCVVGQAPMPCLLVCATDGFFGYVETPSQFEHVVLHCLMSAQDVRHWSALLAQEVESFTGDDASLAIVALGFEDFGALRAYFQPRVDALRSQHIEPMRAVQGGNRTAFIAAREESWRRYRPDYERRLPQPGEGEQ